MHSALKLGQSVLRAIMRMASTIEGKMNGWAATLRLRQRGALVTVETSEGPCGVSDGHRRELKEAKWVCVCVCICVYEGV